MRWRARSLRRRWASANSVGSGSSLARRRQRGACVGADALDHCTQTVGTLGRQMIAKAEFVEDSRGIRRQNLFRRMAGIKRQQDRDQAAHDMRVAVAEISEYRLPVAVAVDGLRQPDLADAALHLVFSGVLGLRHRLQGAAE